MALGLAIFLAIASPNRAQAQAHTYTYIGGDAPILVGDSITFGKTVQYGDGELRLNLSNGTPNDQLDLTSNPNPNTEGAISVDSTGNIFLGNGSGTNRIGAIDRLENGSNGQALTIHFSSPLTNGGFETGDLTGWTAFKQNYTPVYNLDGQGIPAKFNGSLSTANIVVGTVTQPPAYLINLDDQTKSNGRYALHLESKGGKVSPGYGSLHGPYVRSVPFHAFANDKITVDFSAQDGDDAYEVFGFLIGTGGDGRLGTRDDSRTKLFSQRGDTAPFNAISATIPTDGQCQFEFVCGSYDKTGGYALGASLYVDNVRLVSATSVTGAVVETIVNQVTYGNSSSNPDTTTRHLEIIDETATQSTHTATVDIAMMTIDDEPIINIDPKQNYSIDTALTVNLPTGDYQVDVIGKAEGGQFDAWSRKCACRWGTYYSRRWGNNKGLKKIGDPNKYGSIEEALANRIPSAPLTVKEDREVKFYTYSTKGDDNRGGVSLKVEGNGVSNTIDLDASLNINQNSAKPCSLATGDYTVSLVGKAEGGKYDAWSSTCSQNWRHAYRIRGDARATGVETGTYASSTKALENRPAPTTFTLAKKGQIQVYTYSQTPENDCGGVSLQITRTP
jgi:hypothetical protein